MIKLVFLFIFFLVGTRCFSQSKKEIIEDLTKEKDSLNLLISNERSKMKEIVKTNENERVRDQKKIKNLDSMRKVEEGKRHSLELKIKNLDSLLKMEKSSNSSLMRTINQQEDLIKKLKDSIIDFSAKNEGILLIPPPKYAINEKELIKLVSAKMSFTCPEEDVLGNRGPEICIEEIKGIQYFNYRNKIRFLASIGFSFNGSHADVGNNGFVLMQYTGTNWELVDFFEFQAIDEMQFGNAMNINSIGVLGKNSVGFFHELCFTAAGEGPFCSMILIGTNEDHIGLFLYEASGSDESYGMNKKGYENVYSIVETTNEWNDLIRIRSDFRSNSKVKSVLRFNSNNLKFVQVK